MDYSPDPPPRTIVLVEDDEIVRRLLRRVLERAGYAIEECADANEGLRVLSSDTPVDMLLTDLVLPGGMNGAELASAALSMRKGLRVLCMSGYGEDATVDRGRLPTGAAFIQKPFTPSDLTEAIDALFEDRWPERVATDH